MTSPRFSLVTPVYNTPLEALHDMISSVVAQTFPSWELVAVDDCSPSPAVRAALLERAASDPRIVVVQRETNGGIVAASNTGLERAQGMFIGLLDHDDVLAPDALRAMADAIAANPEADYLYSDEDKLGTDGRFYDEFRKPTWSPERLRGHMYLGHFSVLRAALAREVGGFHPEFEGSQDHDLALRVTERARAVVHVPKVLYHWRVVPGSAAGGGDAKPYAWLAGREAVAAHLERTGVAATAHLGDWTSTYRVERSPLPPDVLVSVVVVAGATAVVGGDRRNLATVAVQSLVERGGHSGTEYVIVHNDALSVDVRAQLTRIAPGRTVFVPVADTCSVSEAANRGALAARGEVLVFWGEDIEAVSPELVHKIAAPLFEPGVGVTGPRTLDADGTVANAGLRLEGVGALPYQAGASDGDPGSFAVLCTNREVSAVTADCLAVRRKVFTEVGGFSEVLPARFRDVDLCLKVQAAGQRVVWLADARVRHLTAEVSLAAATPSDEAAWDLRWYRPKERYLRG